jgi:hypothetical protein
VPYRRVIFFLGGGFMKVTSFSFDTLFRLSSYRIQMLLLASSHLSFTMKDGGSSLL